MAAYLWDPRTGTGAFSSGSWIALDGGTPPPVVGDTAIVATLPTSGSSGGTNFDLTSNAATITVTVGGSATVDSLFLLGNTAITAGGALTSTPGGAVNLTVVDGATLIATSVSSSAPIGSVAAALGQAISVASPAFPSGTTDFASAIAANAGSIDQATYGTTATITLGAGSAFGVGNLGAGVEVAFSGHNDLLVFANPGSGAVTIANTITGFDGAQGDRIELAGAGTFVSFTGGANPSVTTTTGTYTFTGLSAVGLTVVDDGAGNVFIACYASGTLIETETGEQAVETLTVGQNLRTVSGGLRPIRWLGWRRYAAPFVRANRHLRPVRIAAGALGGDLPRRDLFVSPLHALLIDGVLVAAAALVNGSTISRVENCGEIAYFHVELDAHDAILAEGAPAESFVDEDSRGMFHGGIGEGARQPVPLYAPRLTGGPVLDGIRGRLAGRAERTANGPLHGHVERLADGAVEGWVFDVSAPDAPVVLDIVADGAVVARTTASGYRADLDRAGIAEGRCGFRAVVPAGIRAVSVRRATDGTELEWMRAA